MSTWTCVQLEMNDSDIIADSLEEMGYVVTKPTTRTTIYADGKGDVAVDLLVDSKSNKGVSYDIGFKKKADGTFEMIVSFADKRRKIKVDGKSVSMMQRLQQLYGTKKVLKYARQRGFMLSSKSVDTDGRIKIKLSVG